MACRPATSSTPLPIEPLEQKPYREWEADHSIQGRGRPRGFAEPGHYPEAVVDFGDKDLPMWKRLMR